MKNYNFTVDVIEDDEIQTFTAKKGLSMLMTEDANNMKVIGYLDKDAVIAVMKTLMGNLIDFNKDLYEDSLFFSMECATLLDELDTMIDEAAEQRYGKVADRAEKLPTLNDNLN